MRNLGRIDNCSPHMPGPTNSGPKANTGPCGQTWLRFCAPVRWTRLLGQDHSDLGFSRAQLLNLFKENYPARQLPSSSCVGCPYHSDSVWKQLKESDPKSFQDAVFIDQALRDVPSIKHTVNEEAYLHRSRTPLLEVDFDEIPSYEDLMLEECEGLCGI